MARISHTGHLVYRGGPNVRNCGRLRPEAKTVGEPPPGGNSKMSPSGKSFDSATNRLPKLSKARPRGLVRPVAKVLSTPVGVNLRIVSLPGSQKQIVDTNRLPVLSKAKPTGYMPVVKVVGPKKSMRAPFDANRGVVS